MQKLSQKSCHYIPLLMIAPVYSPAPFAIPHYPWIFSTKQVTQKLSLKMQILNIKYSCGCFCKSLAPLEQDCACRGALPGHCCCASRAPCSDTSSQEANGALKWKAKSSDRSPCAHPQEVRKGLEWVRQTLGWDPAPGKAMCASPLLHKPLPLQNHKSSSLALKIHGTH